MKYLCTLLLCAAAAADGLDPVSFLAGEFEGEGKHQWGTYTETLTGEWALGRSVLIVRSKSTMQGRIVFEDVRVFSWDAAKKRVRMRQYAMGDLAIYDIEAKDGTVVFKETAHEGASRPEWRYTIRRGEDGFEYRVEAKGKDGVFAPYVAGALRRKTPGPGAEGPLKTLVQRATIAGMQAELHHPDGPGPYPVVVFSPGGAAQTTQGYHPFARRFASWGFATVVVAFNQRDPAKRADLYGKVADWLGGDPPHKDKLDAGRLVACGHSLGGYAAVLAARKDERFKACVALAPSGPMEAPAGRECPVFVVVGGQDRFQASCRNLHASLGAQSYLVEVDGMNHFFAPPAAGNRVLARATAFLQLHVAGDSRYKAFLVAEGDGVAVAAK